MQYISFLQYRAVNYFSSKIFVTIWTKIFSFLEDNIKEHQFFFICYAGYCSEWHPPFCTNKAAFLKREFVVFLII